MHLGEWHPNDFNLFGPRKRMKLFQLMLITYDPKNSKNHAIPTLLCLPGLVNMEKVKTNKKSTLPKSPRVKTFFQLVPFLWHSHQSIMLKLGESWLGIQSTMVYLRKRGQNRFILGMKRTPFKTPHFLFQGKLDLFFMAWPGVTFHPYFCLYGHFLSYLLFNNLSSWTSQFSGEEDQNEGVRVYVRSEWTELN